MSLVSRVLLLALAALSLVVIAVEGEGFYQCFSINNPNDLLGGSTSDTPSETVTSFAYITYYGSITSGPNEGTSFGLLITDSITTEGNKQISLKPSPLFEFQFLNVREGLSTHIWPIPFTAPRFSLPTNSLPSGTSFESGLMMDSTKIAWNTLSSPFALVFRATFIPGGSTFYGWVVLSVSSLMKVSFVSYGVGTAFMLPTLSEAQSCGESPLPPPPPPPPPPPSQHHKHGHGHHLPSNTPKPKNGPLPFPGTTTTSHHNRLFRRESSRRMPVFVHLPKTGGSTIISILKKNVDTALNQSVLFFGMPPAPFQIHDGLGKGDSHVQAIGGHMGYKDIQMVDNYLKENPKELSSPIDFVPFTIMRDPNERLVSFWAYLNEINARNISVAQTVKGMLPNSMYRMLAPLGSDLEDVPSTMAAIKNFLEKEFAVVGLTERFDETLLLLKRKGLINDMAYSKHKLIGEQRMSFDQLDEETQDLIRSKNALDQELYDWAKLRFEELIQQQDASFAQELKEFQESQKLRPECEDDDIPGGWKCDGKKRVEAVQKRLKDRVAFSQKRAEAIKKMEPQDYAMFTIERMLHPRYW